MGALALYLYSRRWYMGNQELKVPHRHNQEICKRRFIALLKLEMQYSPLPMDIHLLCLHRHLHLLLYTLKDSNHFLLIPIYYLHLLRLLQHHRKSQVDVNQAYLFPLLTTSNNNSTNTPHIPYLHLHLHQLIFIQSHSPCPSLHLHPHFQGVNCIIQVLLLSLLHK